MGGSSSQPCFPQLTRRVSSSGGVPLVGPQKDLRGPSGYTPRGLTRAQDRRRNKNFGFYKNKQINKKTFDERDTEHPQRVPWWKSTTTGAQILKNLIVSDSVRGPVWLVEKVGVSWPRRRKIEKDQNKLSIESKIDNHCWHRHIVGVRELYIYVYIYKCIFMYVCIYIYLVDRTCRIHRYLSM